MGSRDLSFRASVNFTVGGPRVYTRSFNLAAFCHGKANFGF